LEDDPAYAAAAGRLAELEARVVERDHRRLELSAAISEGRAGMNARALRRELAEVEDQLAAARGDLAQQRPIVAREKARASKEICERLRPPHREIIKAIAEALKPLSDALIEEREFREALIAAGVEFSGYLRPMPLGSVGCLDDEYSRASAWVAEAREFGLL